jgi:hypothetical protein
MGTIKKARLSSKTKAGNQTEVYSMDSLTKWNEFEKKQTQGSMSLVYLNPEDQGYEVPIGRHNLPLFEHIHPIFHPILNNLSSRGG